MRTVIQENAIGRPMYSAKEERRRVVVEPVFLQCCKDGQVGEIVLDHLRLAAPTDLYNKLLGITNPSTKVRIEDLPQEWRCNVKDEKWRKNIAQRQKKKRIRNRSNTLSC